MCSTLTAVRFIRSVTAVIIGVTAPGVGDAALVGAGELIGGACSRHPGGTVGLITVVEAVVVAVAAPACRHTALVGAGESSGGASVVWGGREETIRLRRCQEVWDLQVCGVLDFKRANEAPNILQI